MRAAARRLWSHQRQVQPCRGHDSFSSTCSPLPPSSPVPPPPFPRISIAPMVDVTDIHFRTFCRLVSSTAHLYTEMLPTMKAISYPSTLDAPLSLNPSHHHLQLGGSSLSSLLLATSYLPSTPSHCPYGSININMGCPSIAAQRGQYGAVTMTDPSYPRLLATLRSALPPHLHLTVKLRVGVDNTASYTAFSHLVRQLYEVSGVRHVIVHCRRALLGMSTSHNRTVPPLQYSYATRLKREWGDALRVEVNGGIASSDDVMRWMSQCDDSGSGGGGGVDGVMIGRWAQRNVWDVVSRIDEWTAHWHHRSITKQTETQTEESNSTQQHTLPPAAAAVMTRESALSAYCHYIDTLDTTARGNHTALLVRPLLSLWQGQSGCREWKKRLVEGSKVDGMTAVQAIQWALDGVYEVRRGGLSAGGEEEVSVEDKKSHVSSSRLAMAAAIDESAASENMSRQYRYTSVTC